MRKQDRKKLINGAYAVGLNGSAPGRPQTHSVLAIKAQTGRQEDNQISRAPSELFRATGR